MDTFNTLRVFIKEPIREQEIKLECITVVWWTPQKNQAIFKDAYAAYYKQTDVVGDESHLLGDRLPGQLILRSACVRLPSIASQKGHYVLRQRVSYEKQRVA